VVVDVDDSMDLLTTETFGPVAPVRRAGSLDEAIARANALPYGLGANVHTRRMDYILRCMEEQEAFRETKHVHLDGRAERKPWWYPYGQQG
jgi:acyl-CoA reductase-like NAD-dependent aldehyde dehydrogenase